MLSIIPMLIAGVQPGAQLKNAQLGAELPAQMCCSGHFVLLHKNTSVDTGP